MQNSNIPTKFAVPFANNAGSYIRPIPQASQVGITPGAASLEDGFPPKNFLPNNEGGIAISGYDMNGILNQLSAWARWQAAGGPIVYDAAFCTFNGGYPAGAVLESTTPGTLWANTVDNNMTNPDAGGAGWVTIGSSAGEAAAREAADTTEIAAREAADTNLQNEINAEIAAREAADTSIETWASATFTTESAAVAAANAALATLFATTSNVTGSRSFGTWYSNTSGKPMFVTVNGSTPTDSLEAMVITLSTGMQYVGAATSGYFGTSGGIIACGIVPAGASYQATISDGGASLMFWTETV